MADLSGQIGELRATVTITRAATGKEETYEIIGRTTPEEHRKLTSESEE